MTDPQFLASLLSSCTGGSHGRVPAQDIKRAVALLERVGFVVSHHSPCRLYMSEGSNQHAVRIDIVSGYHGRQIAEVAP